LLTYIFIIKLITIAGGIIPNAVAAVAGVLEFVNVCV
jgi:hypothetical protein